MAVDLQLTRPLRKLSRAQSGVLLYWQLLDAGLTRGQIRAMVARGTLIRLSRGVYCVADPQLIPLARETAAVHSFGASAFLSHRSAVALRGLVTPDPEHIDVTLIARKTRGRPGIRLHRVVKLDPVDTTVVDGIPATSTARSFVDFAAQAGASEFASALADARAKKLITDRALQKALARAPANHPGAATLRSIFEAGGGYDRSKAERLMRRHTRAAGLPAPLTNVMLHGYLVDFLWPDTKLIVEVDGYLTHGSRQAFESDRRRDQVHIAHGYVVIRITWPQLTQEPMAVIARIAQALALRAAQPGAA